MVNLYAFGNKNNFDSDANGIVLDDKNERHWLRGRIIYRQLNPLTGVLLSAIAEYLLHN